MGRFSSSENAQLGRNFDKSFFTGKIFEKQLLGSSVDLKNRDYQERLKVLINDKGYVGFSDAFQLVRDFYKDDPTDPKKDLPRDLLIEITDRLKLEEGQVKFYSALGTPLDIWHGADGVFEIGTSEGLITVTIDITENILESEGRGKLKADIVLLAETEDGVLFDRGFEQVESYKGDLVRVIYARITEPTSDSYLPGIDLITDQIVAVVEEKIAAAAARRAKREERRVA